MVDSSAVDAAIRGRRTRKRFGGAPIAPAVVDELLGLAAMAPMHRLSNPWRFAVLERPAIVDLGAWLKTQDAIANSPDPEKGPRKLAKLVDHYFPQLGAMIQVTWIRSEDPMVDLEDHAAAAAAVQNLLIAAEARGLASFWASSPALRHPLTLRHLGADPEREGFVGSIWLGTVVDQPDPPPRAPLADVVRHPEP